MDLGVFVFYCLEGVGAGVQWGDYEAISGFVEDGCGFRYRGASEYLRSIRVLKGFPELQLQPSPDLIPDLAPRAISINRQYVLH